MLFVPTARWGFFPLDEELGLLPGHLTPTLQQVLGALVVGVNLLAYALAYRAWQRRADA